MVQWHGFFFVVVVVKIIVDAVFKHIYIKVRYMLMILYTFRYSFGTYVWLSDYNVAACVQRTVHNKKKMPTCWKSFWLMILEFQFELWFLARWRRAWHCVWYIERVQKKMYLNWYVGNMYLCLIDTIEFGAFTYMHNNEVFILYGGSMIDILWGNIG